MSDQITYPRFRFFCSYFKHRTESLTDSRLFYLKIHSFKKNVNMKLLGGSDSLLVGHWANY